MDFEENSNDESKTIKLSESDRDSDTEFILSPKEEFLIMKNNKLLYDFNEKMDFNLKDIINNHMLSMDPNEVFFKKFNKNRLDKEIVKNQILDFINNFINYSRPIVNEEIKNLHRLITEELKIKLSLDEFYINEDSKLLNVIDFFLKMR